MHLLLNVWTRQRKKKYPFLLNGLDFTGDNSLMRAEIPVMFSSSFLEHQNNILKIHNTIDFVCSGMILLFLGF